MSMPSVNGATSVTTRSSTLSSRAIRPACTAAPSATTSSGFRRLCGSRPKSCVTRSTTIGIRVAPPTRITSLTSARLRPASPRVRRMGSSMRARMCSHHLSICSRASGDLGAVVVEFARSCRARGPTAVGLPRQPALGHFALLNHAGDQQRRFQLGPLEEIALRFEHAGGDGAGEVLAAEKALARRGADLERPFELIDDRHVERAAAQIEDRSSRSSSA